MAFRDFFDAYTECALWSSDDDDGTPMDELDNELAPETLAKMRDECILFYETHTEYKGEWLPRSELWDRGGWSDEQAGHDFWLTRNGHGSGFWDRVYNKHSSKIGRLLTNAAHGYKECSLYVGDDGLIYCG